MTRPVTRHSDVRALWDVYRLLVEVGEHELAERLARLFDLNVPDG